MCGATDITLYSAKQPGQIYDLTFTVAKYFCETDKVVESITDILFLINWCLQRNVPLKNYQTRVEAPGNN